MKRHGLVLALGAALVAALSFYPLSAGEDIAPKAPPAEGAATGPLAPAAPPTREGEPPAAPAPPATKKAIPAEPTAPAPPAASAAATPEAATEAGRTPGRTADLHVVGRDGVTMPKLDRTRMVEPAYPEEARKAGVSGKVLLQAIIEEDGRVSEVEVLHVRLRGVDDETTEGPQDEEEQKRLQEHLTRLLVDAAVDAVEQWRYEPATRDGKPVQVAFTVVIQFHLDDEKDPEEKAPTTPV
jgi:protein TonB